MMEDNQNASTGSENQNTASVNTEQGSGGEEQNPQDGKQWNNYQTKELSTTEEQGGAISAEEAAKVFEKEGE